MAGTRNLFSIKGQIGNILHVENYTHNLCCIFSFKKKTQSIENSKMNFSLWSTQKQVAQQIRPLLGYLLNLSRDHINQ